MGIGMMTYDNTARIDDMTTAKFPPVPWPASLTGPALNECPKISKTFIAYFESLLTLTPYQSARDTRADGLDSANFEKSLDQLNKLDEKQFQLCLQLLSCKSG